MVCPKSGYKVISATEILNGMWLLRNGEISFRCFRVYLACFSLVAIREAASRLRRKNRERQPVCPAYRISELSRLTGAQEGEVRRDLRSLAERKLLSFKEGEIVVRKESVPGSEGFFQSVRSPARPIPVPRAALRYLCGETKRSVVLVALSYMIRGLTISRRAGEVKARGSVKLSWVTALAGLSERAAHYGRQELIRLGFISEDLGSTQWKLNRDGAYFEINVDFKPDAAKGNEAPLAPKSSGMDAEPFAPPTAKKALPFAPPYKDRKTSSIEESKDQKAQENRTSGVSGSKVGKATFRNVKAEHLRNFSDMESLYFDACSKGIIVPSEATALNFLSAAVKARSVSEGDPVRIFVAIVRRGLWHHITQAQEDEARKVLLRFREKDPERFRRPRIAA